jgi:hypothetical protein
VRRSVRSSVRFVKRGRSRGVAVPRRGFGSCDAADLPAVYHHARLRRRCSPPKGIWVVRHRERRRDRRQPELLLLQSPEGDLGRATRGGAPADVRPAAERLQSPEGDLGRATDRNRWTGTGAAHPLQSPEGDLGRATFRFLRAGAPGPEGGHGSVAVPRRGFGSCDLWQGFVGRDSRLAARVAVPRRGFGSCDRGTSRRGSTTGARLQSPEGDLGRATRKENAEELAELLDQSSCSPPKGIWVVRLKLFTLPIGDEVFGNGLQSPEGDLGRATKEKG